MRQGERGHFCLAVVFSDNLRRANIHVDSFGTRRLFIDVGFVPHFPFHFSGIAFRHCLDPVVPRPLALGGRRHSAFKKRRAAALVDCVAVRRLEPYGQASGSCVVDNFVEPREVVLALFLFGFRPAALKPDFSYAQRRKIFFVLLVIGVVPVERFAADRYVVFGLRNVLRG